MNRYQNIKIISQSANTPKYYRDSKYPIVPLSIDDIYVVTTIGDRFDLLAKQYYGDHTLWWVISIANDNLPQNSLNPPAGTQIRIPVNVSAILAEYNKLNN